MDLAQTQASEQRRQAASARPRRLRVGAVIAAAAAVGFIAWLLVDSGEGSSNSRESTAVAVTVNGLKTLAGALDQPLYWAGARKHFTYELTRTPDERVYIRYLPPGVGVGEQKPALTIGTYPVRSAFDVTQAAARQEGSVPIKIGNGVAFYNRQRPTNAYIAYRGSDYQIEVFYPQPKLTRQLVASGQIGPVPARKLPGSAARATGAVAISPKGLRTLAAAVKEPIYWAGSEAGMTHELTRTPDGRTYVRYLPQGAQVGEHKPFLTVGTYPLRNAFAATLNVAAAKGSAQIPLGTGRVAFYSTARPTNVYLARQGEDYQVEVFAPSPGAAHRLVSAGRVHAVR